MEGALRDPWEDLHHGVRPVRVVHVHEVDHFCAVGHKDATEEEVDEVDTDHDNVVEVKRPKLPPQPPDFFRPAKGDYD